jgi:hypothetical protein
MLSLSPLLILVGHVGFLSFPVVGLVWGGGGGGGGGGVEALEEEC